MEKAKVYFTDFRVKPFGKNVLQKLTDLLQKAQMDKLGLDGKFVAIKIHFGEPGNLSFLRPNFARAVADEIRRLGGNPFLTDCNTHLLRHFYAQILTKCPHFSPLGVAKCPLLCYNQP